MKKIILTLALALFLIGIFGVAAARTIMPVDGTINISDFVAGNNVTAEFGYFYFAYVDDNVDHSPLILKINISSLNDSYPVWKGDFQLSGYIEKYHLSSFPWIYRFFPESHERVDLTCSENSPLTINGPFGSNIVDVPAGIFYCYNTSNDLRLEEGDNVLLNIKSNQALWPGQYNMSVKFFYVNDTLAPFVNITNKNDFENKYYRALGNIEVQANITDGSPLEKFSWGTIFTPTQNITVPFSHKDNGLYYFTKILPINIPEGNWEMKIFAKDTSGNIGENDTVLRIDNTGPSISLIQPNGSVYSQMLPIEVNVTDAKSGVNDSRVQYRLREMNGTNICPEDGMGSWDCYNSGWISLPHNSGDSFSTEINTTEIGLSGEYWLDVRAYDNLGNEGILS